MKTWQEFEQLMNNYIQLKLSISTHPTPSQAQSLYEAYKVLEDDYNEPQLNVSDMIVYEQDGKLIIVPDSLFGRLDVKVNDNKVEIRSYVKYNKC